MIKANLFLPSYGEESVSDNKCMLWAAGINKITSTTVYHHIKTVQRGDKTFEHTLHLPPPVEDITDCILLRSADLPISYSFIGNYDMHTTTYTKTELKSICSPPKRGVFKMPNIHIPRFRLPLCDIELIIRTETPNIELYVGGRFLPLRGIMSLYTDNESSDCHFEGKPSWPNLLSAYFQVKPA